MRPISPPAPPQVSCLLPFLISPHSLNSLTSLLWRTACSFRGATRSHVAEETDDSCFVRLFRAAPSFPTALLCLSHCGVPQTAGEPQLPPHIQKQVLKGSLAAACARGRGGIREQVCLLGYSDSQSSPGVPGLRGGGEHSAKVPDVGCCVCTRCPQGGQDGGVSRGSLNTPADPQRAPSEASGRPAPPAGPGAPFLSLPPTGPSGFRPPRPACCSPPHSLPLGVSVHPEFPQLISVGLGGSRNGQTSSTWIQHENHGQPEMWAHGPPSLS